MTGLRWNELRELTWGDVCLDADTPFLRVPARLSKNARTAELPMFGTAADEFRRLRPVGWMVTDRVFPLMPEACDWFDEDLKAAGVEKLDTRKRKACFHCLRKTYNTMLQRMNYSDIEIMKFMRVTDRKLIEQTYLDDSQLAGENNRRRPEWWSIQRSPGRSPDLGTACDAVAQAGTVVVGPENENRPEIPGDCHALARTGTECTSGPESSGKGTVFVNSLYLRTSAGGFPASAPPTDAQPPSFMRRPDTAASGSTGLPPP